MTFDEQLSTRELQRALQRSEGRRILLVVLVVLLATLLAVARHLAHGKAMQGTAYAASLALGAIAAVYAMLLFAMVRRAEAREILLPAWLWAASAILESLIPTIAILILQELSAVGRLESLAAPAVLLYCIFIITSILRLRPWLSALSGALSALGHLGLFMRVFIADYDAIPAGSLGFYGAFSAYLLLAGAAATLVSMELRKHLMGSLREADARNTLELVKRELDIARSVQQALMPKAAPDFPGFEIAGWNRPASETGGDYYDWQFMPDGRLAVAIADVTGHGLGPAMLMAVCRAYARACLPVGPELRSAMARMNGLLHGDVSSGRFVTFAVALIDSKSGCVDVLSAGHGPLLYLESATGKISELNGDGIPLGILENEDYGTPRRIQTSPGDVLLLVTDGFIEWARAGDGQQYGVQRLGDLLRTNAALPAQALIERMDADVCAFSGGSPQLDDMTAVVIRRLTND